jgi:hypothetical protein
MTASCSNDRPAASSSSDGQLGGLSTGPASAPTTHIVTTVPVHPSVPPATAPNPGDCQSGAVAVAVSTVGAPLSVCLVTGATMTVTFDKSGGGGMGTHGPWAVPPIRLDRPILTVVSTSPHASVLTAVFRAGAPGGTTVYASYDEGCPPGDATPCTVPPLGMIQLEVTVVAA